MRCALVHLLKQGITTTLENRVVRTLAPQALEGQAEEETIAEGEEEIQLRRDQVEDIVRSAMSKVTGKQSVMDLEA